MSILFRCSRRAAPVYAFTIVVRSEHKQQDEAFLHSTAYFRWVDAICVFVLRTKDVSAQSIKSISINKHSKWRDVNLKSVCKSQYPFPFLLQHESADRHFVASSKWTHPNSMADTSVQRRPFRTQFFHQRQQCVEFTEKSLAIKFISHCHSMWFKTTNCVERHGKYVNVCVSATVLAHSQHVAPLANYRRSARVYIGNNKQNKWMENLKPFEDRRPFEMRRWDFMAILMLFYVV